MNEYRCEGTFHGERCNRLLFCGYFTGTVQIKCRKCHHMNTVIAIDVDNRVPSVV